MFPNWLRRNLGTLLSGMLLIAVILLAMTPLNYPYRHYPGTLYQRFIDSGFYQGPAGSAFRGCLSGIERATDALTGLFNRRKRPIDKGTAPEGENHKLLVVVWEGVAESALNEALKQRKLPNYTKVLNRGSRKPFRTDNWTTLDEALLSLFRVSGDSGDATPTPSASASFISRLKEEGRRIIVIDPRRRLEVGSKPRAGVNQVFPRALSLPLPDGQTVNAAPGPRHWGVPAVSVILLAGLLGLILWRTFHSDEDRELAPVDKPGQPPTGNRPVYRKMRILSLLGFFLFLVLFNTAYFFRSGDFLLPSYQARYLIRHALHPAWDQALPAPGEEWEALIAVHPEAAIFEAAFPASPSSRLVLLQYLDERLGRLLHLAGEDTPVVLVFPWDMASNRRIFFARAWTQWLNRECGEELFRCSNLWGGSTASIECSSWEGTIKDSPEGTKVRKWLEKTLGQMVDPLTSHQCVVRWRFVKDTAWLEFGPEYWVTPEDPWLGWRYQGRYRPPEEGRGFYGPMESKEPVIRRLDSTWKETMGPVPGGSLIAAGFPQSAFRGPRGLERSRVAETLYEAVAGRKKAGESPLRSK